MGGTLSEIFFPALEKNKLNSFAISVGSEIVLLGVVILGILVDLFLGILEVSSFSTSQVFLGFFAY